MSFGTISSESWKPLADDQLSWFRAEQKIFSPSRPLDYTLEIHSVLFGLTYALESVEFPLYAVRSRLHHGRVYLAAVPSAMAENNLSQRLANIRDQSLRNTRNIQRAWERQIKPEVERYNHWLEAAAGLNGSDSELADLVRRLRRARGNQWFVAIRGVNVPNLLLRQNLAEVGAAIVETARTLTEEAMTLVGRRGGELVAVVLMRVGQRLARSNSIGRAEDVFWLEWLEVRESLRSPTDRRALVAQRKRAAESDLQVVVPEVMGPALAPNAPRMYLLKEVLQLLDW
jgi:hypothetical protein